MKTIGRKVIFLTFSLAIVSMLSSFDLVTKIKGDGNITKEKYDIADFDEIKLSCPGNVYYTQSKGTPTLKVETDKNILENLDLIVKDDVLIIRPNKFSVNLFPTKLEVYVSSANLESVKLASSGNIYVDDLNTTDLDVELSGSGSIKFADRLEAVDLEVDISGSGNVCFGKGKVSDAEYSIAGSGTIKAQDLEAQKAEAKIAGSGDVWLNAVQKLSTSIAGSGNVYYKGNPQIKSSTAGSGRVSPIK